MRWRRGFSTFGYHDGDDDDDDDEPLATRAQGLVKPTAVAASADDSDDDDDDVPLAARAGAARLLSPLKSAAPAPPRPQPPAAMGRAAALAVRAASAAAGVRPPAAAAIAAAAATKPPAPKPQTVPGAKPLPAAANLAAVKPAAAKPGGVPMRPSPAAAPRPAVAEAKPPSPAGVSVAKSKAAPATGKAAQMMGKAAAAMAKSDKQNQASTAGKQAAAAPPAKSRYLLKLTVDSTRLRARLRSSKNSSKFTNVNDADDSLDDYEDDEEVAEVLRGYTKSEAYLEGGLLDRGGLFGRANAKDDTLQKEDLNSIDKILDVRLREPEVQAGEGAMTERKCLGRGMETIGSGRGVEEFLCKYKGLAHVHAQWLTRREIESNGRLSGTRLSHFERKKAANRSDPYSESWMLPERVIAASHPQQQSLPSNSGSAGMGVKEEALGPAARCMAAGEHPAAKYLVKWTGLTYDVATWEDLATATPGMVKAYRERESEVAKRANETPAEATASAVAMRAGLRDEEGDEILAGGKGATDTDAKELSQWRPLKDFPKSLFRGGRTLRDYQLEGVNWLRFNYGQGRSVILGDEMGLGKTAQAVCMLQCLRALHGVRLPFLIVVPLSTLQHWAREVAEWTDLHAVVLHGPKEARDAAVAYEWTNPYAVAAAKAPSTAGGPPTAAGSGALAQRAALAKPKLDVCITTYETLTSSSAEVFRKVPRWGYLIVDEAHRLKNREAKALVALRSLGCPFKLALTGTPLQNHVGELWSILNFLDSATFPDLDEFLENFGEMTSAVQVQQLNAQLRPYLLQRKKVDVDLGLTPMEETLVYVEITNFQKRCYRALLEQNRELLLRGAADTISGPSFNNVSMQLRHCCNHPFLIKGVVQAEQLETVTDKIWMERLVGSSGKLVLLDKLLPHLKKQGSRVLLFSQFKMLLDLIEDYVRLRSYAYERLDGSVTGERRQAAIDRFCEPDSESFIFLLGTRAGGVGINLVAADTVIIFDPDWNPQNDVQAQARCHRIGQTKLVRVYKLVTRDTYEMHLFERANQKLGLERAIIGRGGFEGSLDADAEGGGKAKGVGKMKGREIEELLKHGAQKLFTDEHDQQIEQFGSDSIESILERASVTRKLDGLDEGADSTFARASFVANDGDTAVDMNDPDFWTKVLGDDPNAQQVSAGGLVGQQSRRTSVAPKRLTASAFGSGFDEPGKGGQGHDGEDAPTIMAGAPWTKAQLVAIDQGLNSLGYGKASIIHATNEALSGRTIEEVTFAIDWVVSACVSRSEEAAQAKAVATAVEQGQPIPFAQTGSARFSMRVWHYLRAGAIPTDVGSGETATTLLGEPVGVHAPVIGAVAWFETRLGRNALQLTAQLVDMQRLRAATDAAKEAGLPLRAPKTPSRGFRPPITLPGGAVPPPAAGGASPVWSFVEDEALLAGIIKHGFGNWELMFADEALEPRALHGLSVHGPDKVFAEGDEETAAAAVGVDTRALTRRAKLLLSCLPALPAPAQIGRSEMETAGKWLATLYPPGFDKDRVFDVNLGAAGGGGGGVGAGDAASNAKAREREERQDERTRAVVERWLTEFVGKVERHVERTERVSQKEARQLDKEAAERARENAVDDKRRKVEERERAREDAREDARAAKAAERAGRNRDEFKVREARLRHLHSAIAYEKGHVVHASLTLLRAQQPSGDGVDAPRETPRVQLTLTVPKSGDEPIQLRDGIERILTDYDYKSKYDWFSKEHPWCRLLDRTELGLQLALGDGYSVRSSMGKGGWARVPWLCVSDPSESSLQHGLHVQILFRADMSGIYLTLGQSIAKLKAAFGPTAAHKHLEHVSRFVKTMVTDEKLLKLSSGFDLEEPLDLRAGKSAGIALDYEKGCLVSRLYDRSEIPSEAVLLGHINELLDAYAKVLKDEFYASNIKRPIDAELEAVDRRLHTGYEPDDKARARSDGRESRVGSGKTTKGGNLPGEKAPSGRKRPAVGSKGPAARGGAGGAAPRRASPGTGAARAGGTAPAASARPAGSGAGASRIAKSGGAKRPVGSAEEDASRKAPFAKRPKAAGEDGSGSELGGEAGGGEMLGPPAKRAKAAAAAVMAAEAATAGGGDSDDDVPLGQRKLGASPAPPAPSLGPKTKGVKPPLAPVARVPGFGQGKPAHPLSVGRGKPAHALSSVPAARGVGKPPHPLASGGVKIAGSFGQGKPAHALSTAAVGKKPAAALLGGGGQEGTTEGHEQSTPPKPRAPSPGLPAASSPPLHAAFSPEHPDYPNASLPVVSGAEASRPLCAGISAQSSLVLKAGAKVAVLIRDSKGEESRILATVKTHLGVSRRYVVTDDDTSVNGKEHTVPERDVLPLPTSLPDRFLAEHEFPRASLVFALWPDSTCFYHAVVGFPPSQRPERDYAVAFADDKDVAGHPLVRRVPPRYVVQMRPGTGK
mmetsp:Transcript_46978/g.109578  ORF Transcript_46978/g.109578 Transcript_46978/m.109578 type:complete len:2415 (-) Transcript_46978:291-7535(-)